MNRLTKLEQLAIRAHRASTSWSEFWEIHRHTVGMLEPHDRRAYHRVVRRLSHLVTCGDLDGERPLDNPLCPWDDADQEHVPA